GAGPRAILKQKTPARRVVLHLIGKGTRLTSTLRVKGIQHLVLYFEPHKDPKDALKLGAKLSGGGRVPLIDVQGGHLELIGARIELSPVTIVPTIIQVQGGDLT